MLVVADTSPFIVLIATGDLNVLPRLFNELIVPPEVIAELGGPNRSAEIRDFAAALPAWIVVRSASRVTAIPSLDLGETAAICLATELQADAILIDERRGRNAARTRGLRPLGTVGVLELAAFEGLLDLKQAFERLRRTNFWVTADFLDNRLRVFNRGRGNP
jgi:predicted nucleic acid-binding protein